jgi:hypothetical protein
MRGIWHILAILALLAPAQASEVIAPERVDAFVDVIAQNGCRMNVFQADKVLPEAGFNDVTETKTITEMLISSGRAHILDGQLVVFGGSCGAGTKYSGRERFFAALADNGCSMTTKQAEVILPPVGVELQEVRLLMEGMLSAGEVSLSADETTVHLDDKVCSKYKGLSGVMAASKPQKPAPKSPEEIRKEFLAYMASVNCSITRSDAQNELPRAGFKAKDIRPIIQALLKAGDAEMTGEDDLLVIKPEVCQ